MALLKLTLLRRRTRIRRYNIIKSQIYGIMNSRPGLFPQYVFPSFIVKNISVKSKNAVRKLIKMKLNSKRSRKLKSYKI